MAKTVQWGHDYWSLNGRWLLDFEQSLFSADLVRGIHTCMSAFSHAWSFAFLAHFAQQTEKKERLLVV